MKDDNNNIQEYNLEKEQKLLVVFDDMVHFMIVNKLFYPIVSELFLRGQKLNVSFCLLNSDIFQHQRI